MKKTIGLLIFILVSSVDLFSIGTVVALTGNVFNEVDKKPLTVNIKLYDINGKRVGATRSMAIENGSYYLAGLKAGKSYKVELSKKGYFNEIYEIAIPETDKYLEVSRDFLIKPLKEGVKIPLPVAPFELRKSKLRFGSDIFLNDMYESLKNNPSVVVEIKSFPDNKLSSEQATSLTQERSKALMDYFIDKGISGARLTTSGSSSIDPDNPLPTEKQSKGKRYIGKSYLVIKSFDSE
ncbi:MAG: hypothetical protein Kapaf2KO_14430 [Candidatus Kapaibacteriales bacterium]